MNVKTINLILAIALVISLGLTQPDSSFSKDKGFTPEEVVAAHLKSIGAPEFLASINNRGMSGNASVKFIQGGVGAQAGRGILISSGHSLSIILKYGGADYPGEYFAYDGTDVEVANITPGQRSPLGDFIFRYKGVMREGLLGGVLSLGWPLLEVQKRNPSLKYKRAKVEGRELHEIDYTPKGGMNNINVKLFFEPETFRHVRTEYTLKVHGEQTLQPSILDPVEDSNYLLVEKFDDFKEVEFKDPNGSETRRLILPHSYALVYSVQGQGSSFLGQWNIVAEQWMQNGKIDPLAFKVH